MNRSFVTAPVAVVMTVLTLASATPAFAQTDVCEATPTAIRAIAATGTDADANKSALRLVKVGVQLCEAGNKREANLKFKSAAKALNVEYASLIAAK